MRKHRRKGFRWSRQARDRPRRLKKLGPVSHYTYDANDAGEPMLSWAQAQQTVKLVRGQSAERFTIANELDVKINTTHHAQHKDKPTKTSKKTSALATSKDSFDLVEHLQKSVESVLPPPDAQQESYVCDEEDLEMLKLVNSKKRFSKHGVISVTAFEDAITQMERESTKCRGVNTSFNLPVDEDAVCSVCQKGDCDNTNMILFCDMCNLAVHQECYGVPYIPEGQWHCRRCMMPSGDAKCLLCPNPEGALKQTEDGHWAHVICAMYMPRVNFKSTQLLEPIMNIDKIEKSRWKLKCAVCKAQPDYDKDQHMGACIQCEEATCKTAFHVTCAQKAGYYMELKPLKEDEDVDAERDAASQSGVKALAFCEKHSRVQPQKKDLKNSSEKVRLSGGTKAHQQSRVDSLVIDPEKLYQIAVSVKLEEKPVLFDLIINYWKSKRRHRNGLPLLKRPKGRNVGSQRAVNYEELEQSRAQIKLALRVTEKLRTLTEYKLRQDRNHFKRDKLLDVRQRFEVMPGKSVLDHLFDRIKLADKEGYFAIPVTEKIAPRYLSIISYPMDFSTMNKKLDNGLYGSFEEFEKDVLLIINNCLQYNTVDTIFHPYALTFRSTVTPMLEAGKLEYKCFVEKQRTSVKDLLNYSEDDSIEQPSVIPVENGVKSNGYEDELLSEISAAEDNAESPKECESNVDIPSQSLNTDLPVASTSSLVLDSHSPQNSRAIPLSPKPRKTQMAPESHFDDSNDAADSGPARKRIRTTPGDSDEVASSSSQVPAPQLAQATPPHPALLAYRCGKLIALASESEPDPPFTSEDSTDLPSSDCDVEDGPARHLRRKRSATFPREYQEIRFSDFVWAKSTKTWYPAIVVDPRAVKGYCVRGGLVCCQPPPSSVIAEKKMMEKKLSGPLLLVNFFDAKRNWAWVQRDKLDLMLIDASKDEARLKESMKVAERKNVRKAYDLALKFMDLPGPGGLVANGSPSLRGSSPIETDASDTDGA